MCEPCAPYSAGEVRDAEGPPEDVCADLAARLSSGRSTDSRAVDAAFDDVDNGAGAVDARDAGKLLKALLPKATPVELAYARAALNLDGSFTPEVGGRGASSTLA